MSLWTCRPFAGSGPGGHARRLCAPRGRALESSQFPWGLRRTHSSSSGGGGGSSLSYADDRTRDLGGSPPLRRSSRPTWNHPRGNSRCRLRYTGSGPAGHSWYPPRFRPRQTTSSPSSGPLPGRPGRHQSSARADLAGAPHTAAPSQAGALRLRPPRGGPWRRHPHRSQGSFSGSCVRAWRDRPPRLSQGVAQHQGGRGGSAPPRQASVRSAGPQASGRAPWAIPGGTRIPSLAGPPGCCHDELPSGYFVRVHALYILAHLARPASELIRRRHVRTRVWHACSRCACSELLSCLTCP